MFYCRRIPRLGEPVEPIGGATIKLEVRERRARALDIDIKWYVRQFGGGHVKNVDAMWISDAYRPCTRMCKTRCDTSYRDETIHACKRDVSLFARELIRQ